MRRVLLPFLGAILLLGGCVSASDLKRLEDQIADLQDQVADLKRSASSRDEVAKLNETLARQAQTLMNSNADLSVKVSEIDDKIQNSQGSIEQTNYRIDRLVQQINQTQRDVAEVRNSVRSTPPVGSTGEGIQDEITVPAGPVEDPLEVYQSAYRDYQRGNFELALQGFRDYLKNNPNSDLADNAAYWIGDSLYSQKQYREAIGQFDRVINTYTTSDKVPAALLKKGYSYIELGEKAQGIVQLQYVIHEHPRSQEASLARQKLKSLGIETR